MAMANMNLIGVFGTVLWPVQALACGGGGGVGGGGATKDIIPAKFSNFGDIISVCPKTVLLTHRRFYMYVQSLCSSRRAQ